MDNNPYVQYAIQAAQRAGINPALFVRQINQESGFNPTAGSPAGAQGIAQIMPQYHPGVDTSDPYASLDYAANLMASHLQKYGGRYDLALAAYNAGGGAVDQYGGVPPYEETQNYVSRIMGSDNGARAGGAARGGQPAWAGGISQLPATSTGTPPPSLTGGLDAYRRQAMGIQGIGNAIGSWLDPNAHPALPGRGPASGWLPDWMTGPLGGSAANAATVPGSHQSPDAQGRNTGYVGGGSSSSRPDPLEGFDPNDWRSVLAWYLQNGKPPPFFDQAGFEAWKTSQAGSNALDDEYKRAQIAHLQRQGQQSGADNAFRAAQLAQQQWDTYTKLRSGPQNLLKYLYTDAGVPFPTEAASWQEHMPTGPTPLWAGGQDTPVVVTPPVVKPTVATPAAAGLGGGTTPNLVAQGQQLPVPKWGQTA